MPAEPHRQAPNESDAVDANASVFTRVSRRLPHTRDPREDRLTEITAALMEADEGFARRFVAALLPGDGDGWTTRSVRTQRPVRVAGRARRIDLELMLEANGQRRMVWVEVKHGARESADQLSAYRTAMAESAGVAQTELLLLVPSNDVHWFDPGSVDKLVTWQEVADRLERSPHPADQDSSDVTRWLSRQYLAYLRDTEAVAALHPSPTQLADNAALRAISEYVFAAIDRPRPDQPGTNSSFEGDRDADTSAPPQAWCQHTSSAAAQDQWRLEWGLTTRADFEVGSRQQQIFYAGWVGFGGRDAAVDPTAWCEEFERSTVRSSDLGSHEDLLPARKGARIAGEQNVFFVRTWPAEAFLRGDEQAGGRAASVIAETLGACEGLGPPVGTG